mmetsp:Transcript_6912/g.11961  ORF Transcript_6912/g.11961 Transcript_6912/m.11961 type:complete len:100 (+) Transcript_6912:134-433(+)|eukprot:CAMPEP_0198219670 /NCGR_PEP_ID=MMETSP1445-20131203/75619_1 /TAXON_ID=36898 /ORGANISM="Pyramimonas sp., Strain CCMP2087" /LENGTH=99 /DNA_ID=CAMNT_0043897173 /DNA_START=90 /DNA_END=389 /DNA_ORIENTATION=-
MSEAPSTITSSTYFDGNVQSLASTRHGCKFSIGVLLPGTYHFGTAAAERMNCTSGEMVVKIDGSDAFRHYPRGTSFECKKDHGFDVVIEVATTYLCEYL